MRRAWPLLLIVLATGCFFRTVREQQARSDALVTIAGTVRAEHATGRPLVVVLLGRDGSGTTIRDHFVLEKPGRWIFTATPGTYGLAAFEDRNADLHYDPDEPALVPADRDFVAYAAGQERRDVALTIPTRGRAPVGGPVDIAAVQARTPPDQLRATLGALAVAGDVVPLDDPRFDREHGAQSLWAPFDFVFDVRPGIYFAAPYDPGKIPVLFVHGITGTPRELGPLAAALDPARQQAWYFYYPSGAAIDTVAEFLSELVTRLHVRYGFRELYVVAHSMGGLVARDFILHHAAASGDYVTRFVSIATPWSGHELARRGVEEAPAVPRSWIGVASGSEFLTRLFYDGTGAMRTRRRLPPHLKYDLLFTYRRNARRRGESDDGVISLASQLRPEAQDEAATIRGFDESHTSVLGSREAIALLRMLLE
jgi:pimeloyl-ACP methyl ester carboxylesterase